MTAAVAELGCGDAVVRCTCYHWSEAVTNSFQEHVKSQIGNRGRDRMRDYADVAATLARIFARRAAEPGR